MSRSPFLVRHPQAVSEFQNHVCLTGGNWLSYDACILYTVYTCALAKCRPMYQLTTLFIWPNPRSISLYNIAWKRGLMARHTCALAKCRPMYQLTTLFIWPNPRSISLYNIAWKRELMARHTCALAKCQKSMLHVLTSRSLAKTWKCVDSGYFSFLFLSLNYEVGTNTMQNIDWWEHTILGVFNDSQCKPDLKGSNLAAMSILNFIGRLHVATLPVSCERIMVRHVSV